KTRRCSRGTGKRLQDFIEHPDHQGCCDHQLNPPYLATCQLVGEGDDEGAAVGTWSAYSGSVPSSTGGWNSALSPPTESTASRKSPGAALTVSSDTASPDSVPR